MPPWCHRVTQTGTSGTRKAASGGEGWRVQQDRASSGRTFLAASPTEVRWQWGHSPSLGDQGWVSSLSLWDPYRDLLTGSPGRGVSPPTMLDPILSLCLACFKQLRERVQTIPVRMGMAEVYWLSPRC